MKIGTLFSGGGGVEVGAKAAGLELAWGIEYDDEIAAYNRRNLGGHCVTADVLDVKPKNFTPVQFLHASPPCPNFSIAKKNNEEMERDWKLAEAVCDFIVYHRPLVFSLENVYGYRKSNSWRIIKNCLTDLGYGVDFWNLNAADYGVPQTRRRMIVIARRDGKTPDMPKHTHVKREKMLPVFETRKQWVGWYEAVEDMIGDLPAGEFAPWQLERMPDELREIALVEGAASGTRPPTIRGADEPAFTITTSTGGRLHRAFLVGDSPNRTSGARIYRNADEPSFTVKTDTGGRLHRAFIIDGRNGGENRDLTIRLGDQPMCTVSATDGRRPSSMPRAFIVDGQSNSRGTKITLRHGDEPMYTVGADTGHRRPQRAYVTGRVVVMTPRALARFQSFPDWYELPAPKGLATRIIGNAVPPLLMEKIYRPLIADCK